MGVILRHSDAQHEWENIEGTLCYYPRYHTWDHRCKNCGKIEHCSAADYGVPYRLWKESGEGQGEHVCGKNPEAKCYDEDYYREKFGITL